MPSSVASTLLAAGAVVAIAGFGVLALVFACLAVAIEVVMFYLAGTVS